MTSQKGKQFLVGHKNNADIAFLQETYSTPDIVEKNGDFSGPGKCSILTVPTTVEAF